jgi:hypothetical protein
MPLTRRPRGVSIVEALISLAILTIGASGVMAMHSRSQAFLGDSMHLVRAKEVAQDLLSQVELWDFNDPRLANTNLSNDADPGDRAGRFDIMDSPPADHGEADITGLGPGWVGLPTSEVQEYGMERYLNVRYQDDQNGNAVWDAVRVAVVVRWRIGASWRTYIVHQVKLNPGDAQ